MYMGVPLAPPRSFKTSWVGGLIELKPKSHNLTRYSSPCLESKRFPGFKSICMGRKWARVYARTEEEKEWRKSKRDNRKDKRDKRRENKKVLCFTSMNYLRGRAMQPIHTQRGILHHLHLSKEAELHFIPMNQVVQIPVHQFRYNFKLALYRTCTHEQHDPWVRIHAAVRE